MTSFKAGVWGYGSYFCDKCGQHMYVWSNIPQKSVTSFMDTSSDAPILSALRVGVEFSYALRMRNY